MVRPAYCLNRSNYEDFALKIERVELAFIEINYFCGSNLREGDKRVSLNFIKVRVLEILRLIYVEYMCVVIKEEMLDGYINFVLNRNRWSSEAIHFWHKANEATIHIVHKYSLGISPLWKQIIDLEGP